MTLPTNAPLPDGLIVNDSYVLVWGAVDPTTGAAVSGVVVSGVSVQGDDLGTGSTGGGGNVVVGPFMLVPGPDA